jgi:2-keto-4-pentenoate hydratase/2-oxohepta-3-ene-1,7-dioic acid hydratase in catechol pathway
MMELPVKNRRDTYTVNPTKLIALGLNYRAHIAESVSVKVKGFTDEVPTEPLLFPKTPNVLVGPDQTIVIPQFLNQYGFKTLRTDYEAELALIIGNRCKDVPAVDALGQIFGYTCMNDVSQRNIQNSDRTGWYRGKSFDTFGPIGPQVVLAQDLPDPQNLNICCRLNGVTVQEGNTRQMIFGIPEIIAFVSKNFTLMPGDIILTGTPAGVGPLSHGDTIEVEIEHIGVLKNTVVDETV